MWELIVAHALFAGSYTFGKLGISYAPPIFIVGLRVILIGAICMGYALVTRQSFFIASKDVKYIFQIMLFQIYLTYFLSFIALPYIPSTRYALIFGFTPFIIALFSYVKGHEVITVQKLLGLFIGFAGFIPTIFLKPHNPSEPIIQFTWAEVIIFIAALCWSYGWVLVNQIQSKKNYYSSAVTNGITLSTGGILLLINSYAFEQWTSHIMYWTWGFWISLMGAVISTGSSYIINYWFLRRFSATFVMLALFIDPLYAALYGRIFLGEVVQWSYFLSIGIIMIGLYLYYQEELAQTY